MTLLVCTVWKITSCCNAARQRRRLQISTPNQRVAHRSGGAPLLKIWLLQGNGDDSVGCRSKSIRLTQLHTCAYTLRRSRAESLVNSEGEQIRGFGWWNNQDPRTLCLQTAASASGLRIPWSPGSAIFRKAVRRRSRRSSLRYSIAQLYKQIFFAN